MPTTVETIVKPS